MLDKYEQEKRAKERARLWGKILMYAVIGGFVGALLFILFVGLTR